MFTGLVEELGTVDAIERGAAGARLGIRATEVKKGLAIGDSVAVNGACLTAVGLRDDGFSVDCVAETLRRTALGQLEVGASVNLERALKADARLGGHIVQGHIDATGTVRSAHSDGDSVLLEIAVAPEHLRYVVEKGSIAVDGVSLTVADRLADGFRVALIPHTMAHTTLGTERVDERVNLELDLIAKYVEALTTPYREPGTP
ncbi:MAG: riboflavin synthase [Thermoleophilia bacterium]|nr:riboflavin synthase [Thermoleophilia bacterium]MDH3724979.1 riboflavin synthase [Thermoleophilia bacterium]